MVGMEEKWCSPTIDHRPYSILDKCDNTARERSCYSLMRAQIHGGGLMNSRLHPLFITLFAFFFCSWFESTNGQNRKSRVRMWRKFIYMLISGPLNLCTPASAIHQRVDGFHATHARRFYRFVIRLFGV